MAAPQGLMCPALCYPRLLFSPIFMLDVLEVLCQKLPRALCADKVSPSRCPTVPQCQGTRQWLLVELEAAGVWNRTTMLTLCSTASRVTQQK